MKKISGLLLIFLLTSGAFSEENGRKGFRPVVDLSPAFTPAFVFTSADTSHGSFTKYRGGVSVGLHLGYSSGSTVSSFLSSFSWFFPSSYFDCSIFAGYGLTRYIKPEPPSLVFEFIVGPEIRMMPGLDKVAPVFLGIKTGLNIGYELNRRIIVWAGFSGGYGYRGYVINSVTIDAVDLSNTIRDLGPIPVQENLLNGSLTIAVSWSLR